MIVLECQICGEDYSVPPYRVKESRYCSMACVGRARGIRMIGNHYRARLAPANKGTGKGWVEQSGYRRVKVDGHDIMEHRRVWAAENGPIPEGYLLHHKNGGKADNRLENLELMRAGGHSSLHNRQRAYRTGWHHSAVTKEKIRRSNIQTKGAQRR